MLKFDSRQIKSGDIFVAIKGKHNDGNNYAQAAIDAGAKLVVTSNVINNDYTLTVPNPIAALIRLGKYFRTRANLKTVIGITGSCGKTTVRNWIFSTLNFHFGKSQINKIIQSLSNYNTMISMPLNYEQLNYNTEVGVFELGTNSVGEILPLAKYVRPNIAIITNIYESHIGNFKDINELAIEKISIIDGMRKYGMLLYDGECKFKTKILEKCKKRNVTPVSIGFTKDCEFSVHINDYKVTVTSPTHVYKYSLKIGMKHYAYMSAIVIAILEIMKIDVYKCIPCIEELMPLPGRGFISDYEYNNKKFKLIDETYNASPSAMLGALEGLKQYRNRKIIVIGEMLELGNKSVEYHAKVARKLRQLSNCSIYFIGRKSLWSTMKKYVNMQCIETTIFESECNAFEHNDVKSLTNNFIIKLLNTIQDGDILFLKGSRSIGLDKFIKYIKCSIM